MRTYKFFGNQAPFIYWTCKLAGRIHTVNTYNRTNWYRQRYKEILILRLAKIGEAAAMGKVSIKGACNALNKVGEAGINAREACNALNGGLTKISFTPGYLDKFVK